MRPILLMLIAEFATEKEVLARFKKLGYGEKMTLAIMKEQGISFPKVFVYNDRNPSPDRVYYLRELSMNL